MTFRAVQPGRRRLERQTEAILVRLFGSPPATRQLFILGWPRSGTTLIYQYVVHRLRVAYLTNGVGDRPDLPCLTTWWQRIRHGTYVSDFESHYGKVQGPVAPREGGAFWARWFDLKRPQTRTELSPAAARELRSTIHCVQRSFGGLPFVNKNVLHGMHVDALAALFPEARFLFVERDLDAVALSLLRARYALLDDPRQWISIRPPGAERLSRLPVVEQVAGQIELTRTFLQEELGGLTRDRVLRIRYEDFCEEPESLTRSLLDPLGRPGYRNPPVDRFSPSRVEPRTTEEEELLRRIRGADSPVS